MVDPVFGPVFANPTPQNLLSQASSGLSALSYQRQAQAIPNATQTQPQTQAQPQTQSGVGSPSVPDAPLFQPGAAPEATINQQPPAVPNAPLFQPEAAPDVGVFQQPASGTALYGGGADTTGPFESQQQPSAGLFSRAQVAYGDTAQRTGASFTPGQPALENGPMESNTPRFPQATGPAFDLIT